MNTSTHRPPRRRRRVLFLNWTNAIAIAFHIALFAAVVLDATLPRAVMIVALTVCLIGDLYLAHVLKPRGAK
jgi:threonine/homoserine/homoserine lactone efflux protein